MKWEPGRQGTGYLKKLLAQGKAWDCWLLKYPPWSKIPWHTDPVTKGLKHYRINLVLWGPQSFRADTPPIFKYGPLVFFRPDTTLHKVKGTNQVRYVLSFGWVTKDLTSSKTVS
jgi:hypothetical protein